jgi:hypothetical protein
MLQAVQLGTTAQESKAAAEEPDAEEPPPAAAAGGGSTFAFDYHLFLTDEQIQDWIDGNDAIGDVVGNARAIYDDAVAAGVPPEKAARMFGGPEHRGHKRKKADEALPQELHVIKGAKHACAGHVHEVVGLVCQFLERLPLTQLA